MSLRSLDQLDYMRLLPPETTAAVSRLEFLARKKMTGTLTGRHSSPDKGFSVEFAEHRQYVPGDDPKNLDWKVYGKKDRYYIKQYIEETNLRTNILLDCSGSMKYRGDEAAKLHGERLSKFEYGQYLAAALSYLFIRQQDAVGLVTFDDKIREYVPAKSRPSQVRQLLELMNNTQPGGDTNCAEVLHEIAERVHRRGLLIMISDLFDDPEKIIEALHHFAYRGHEIVLFHIMAEEELTFPFDRFNRFENLELENHRLEIDPKALKAHYLRQVKGFVKRIEQGCGQAQADYVPVTTKEPFDRVLSNYVSRRRSGR